MTMVARDSAACFCNTIDKHEKVMTQNNGQRPEIRKFNVTLTPIQLHLNGLQTVLMHFYQSEVMHTDEAFLPVLLL